MRTFAQKPAASQRVTFAVSRKPDGPSRIQPRLRIGPSGDAFEQEADRIADQVMRMREPRVQRDCACGGSCAKCQGEGASSGQEPAAPPVVSEVLSSPGEPLDSGTKAFFEPRFGQDFSRVRVHADSRAMESARSIHALAYTARNHIVFGENQYRPRTSEGQRLLAHELAHVRQQNGSADAAKAVRRTVAASSNCPANVHNAPADPLADLQRIDKLAQNMALGSSHVLFLESLTFRDPTFGPSYVSDAYRDWFGTPEQTPSGTWRSRFRRAPFATEGEAAAHEMQALSDRFEGLHRWLAGDIRYVCPGTSPSKLPGCGLTACTTQAWSCPGARAFSICPTFWGATSDAGLASLLIHESIHTSLGLRKHPSATVRDRGVNSACYQGFVDQLYNTGSSPLPSQCTPLSGGPSGPGPSVPGPGSPPGP